MNSPKPKSSRAAQVTLALLAAALAGWAVYSAQTIRQLQTAQADLQTKLDAETKQAKAYDADAIRWRKLAEGPQVQNGQAGAAPGASSAANESKRNFHPDEVAAMVTSQGAQSLISSQQAAMIAMAYKDLLDRFHLSPEERDYMQKLLLEKQMAQVTNGMQMMNPALSPDERAALRQQILDGMTAADAKIHEFLNSDADYATYQSYSQQETERTEVGMYESSLTGDNAIDPATADSLTALLADTRKSFPFTVDFYNHANFANPAVLNAPTVNKFLDEQAQYQAQVADKAAAMLTPVQLQAFKQNQAAMREMTKMQMNNIIQMSGGGQ